MNGLGFASPNRLWLLLLIPLLLAGYVVLLRRRPRFATRLPDLDLLASVAPRLGWRRHLPAALLLVALAGTTAAFAEPTADVQVPRERATVIVTLDVSYSMSATDVSPDRISAAKAAAVKFVDSLPPRFNVGLVAFSGSASVVVPATQEHQAVSQAISGLGLGNGTAIGEAVVTSVQAVQALAQATGDTDPAPAHIVLLSDGGNTAGRPISSGVQEALTAGIPVSTIAYGTPDGAVQVGQELVRVPVDGPALAELARETGGHAYAAASGNELQSVYADIGSSVGSDTVRREVSSGFAGVALLLTVVAGATAVAMSPRLT
jgi:Ca-activated chloride channel family protein